MTTTLLDAFDRFAFGLQPDQRATIDAWLEELSDVYGFTDNQAKAIIGLSAWMSVAFVKASE